jgi:hypothetical protein
MATPNEPTYPLYAFREETGYRFLGIYIVTAQPEE